MPVGDELHVTEFVRFCVLPSVKVPVAENCCVFPSEMDGAVGVTAIETSTGAPTVKVVEPWMEPKVASTVVPPWATLLARPLALIVAICDDELQVTDAVRFCVFPLLNLPLAAYCCVVPSGIVALAGVTVREVKPVALPFPLRAATVGLPNAP